MDGRSVGEPLFFSEALWDRDFERGEHLRFFSYFCYYRGTYSDSQRRSPFAKLRIFYTKSAIMSTQTYVSFKLRINSHNFIEIIKKEEYNDMLYVNHFKERILLL